MKYLYAALCGAVLVGAAGCTKKPKYNPDEILIHFDAPLDSIGGPQK